MATVAEAIDRAGEMLGILDIGGTISATDSTRLTSAYDEVFSELKETGVASWASAGVIPDEMLSHVASLMAFSATESYRVSDKRYQRISFRERMARRELRRLTIPDYESLDNPVDY